MFALPASVNLDNYLPCFIGTSQQANFVGRYLDIMQMQEIKQLFFFSEMRFIDAGPAVNIIFVMVRVFFLIFYFCRRTLELVENTSPAF